MLRSKDQALIAAVALFAAHLAHTAPTLIVDINGIGAEELAALKANPKLVWHAEFGTELLIGVRPDAVIEMQSLLGVRPGLGDLEANEIFVRDHPCAEDAKIAPLGVVGGFEVLKMPPALIRYASKVQQRGSGLPADRVVAKLVSNQIKRSTRRVIDPRVQQLVNRVDGQRWRNTVAALANFSRNTINPELALAGNYITQNFAAADLQTSNFDALMQPNNICANTQPFAIRNVIGRKQGQSLPDEWIVIGGHYDSRNQSSCSANSVSPQPGANDNASGCAGVMELARVFQNVDTALSMVFICFSGEEQGLIGSSQYVAALQASGDLAKVKFMLNLDMIGHDPNNDFTAKIETIPFWQTLYPEFQAAATNYAPELNLVLGATTFAYSDHWYFINSADANTGQPFIPGIFTWENGAGIYPQYHTDQDRLENMTNAAGLAAAIMKMDTAVLADRVGLLTGFTDGFE